MGAIVACELLQHFHALPVDNVVFEAAACSVSNFKTNVIPFLEEQNLRTQMATLEGKDPADVVKTRVYNLCLHDDAENADGDPEQRQKRAQLVELQLLQRQLQCFAQNPEYLAHTANLCN